MYPKLVDESLISLGKIITQGFIISFVFYFCVKPYHSGNADAWDAIGLLVLLRLWRIVRIANGKSTSITRTFVAEQ